MTTPLPRFVLRLSLAVVAGAIVIALARPAAAQAEEEEPQPAPAQPEVPAAEPGQEYAAEAPSEPTPPPKKKAKKTKKHVVEDEDEDEGSDFPFARKGQMVLRGAVGLSTESGAVKDKSGMNNITTAATTVEIDPQLGYFVADFIEVGGMLTLDYRSNQVNPGGGATTTSTHATGLTAYGTYHFVRSDDWGLFAGGGFGYLSSKAQSVLDGKFKTSAGLDLRGYGGFDFLFGSTAPMAILSAYVAVIRDDLSTSGGGSVVDTHFAVFSSLGIVFD